MIDLLEQCQASGTDKQYRAFIQRQPSCISGRYSEWVDGEGRCEAAHVRRAGKSGTAFKSPYSCVPLTRQEHADQHQHGETSLAPKDWWDAQVIKYRKLWVQSKKKPSPQVAS